MPATRGCRTMSASPNRTTAISGTRSRLRRYHPGPTCLEQVGLVGIAGQHHGRAPAQAREQHLELGVGAVLRLVDHHIAIAERTTAHVRPTGAISITPSASSALRRLVSETLGERVVKRAQIGGELFLQIARKKAEAFARFHRGTRQHDAAATPSFERFDGLGDGEIGLAGAGRTESENDGTLFDGNPAGFAGSGSSPGFLYVFSITRLIVAWFQPPRDGKRGWTFSDSKLLSRVL